MTEINLFLRIAGVEVQGEFGEASLGRANSIPCLGFEQAVSTSGTMRSYAPIRIRKRIDKSSPLIAKALSSRQVVDATFRFYRPNPAGDGTTEQYFTVTIGEGLVTAHSFISALPDTVSARLPAIEDVAFSFGRIEWTYTSSGATHQDNVPVGRPALPKPN